MVVMDGRLCPQEDFSELATPLPAGACRRLAQGRRRQDHPGRGQGAAQIGELTIAEVISSGESDEAIARMRIVELLEALPGIGKVRAAAIMEQLGIAASRRVRGLGIHQRRALVDFIDDK